MTAVKDGAPLTTSFHTETAAVLGRLQATMIDLTQGVPGGLQKSRDVQKHLGVDAKLSWQVFRIVTSVDPLAAGMHVPSPATMQKLLVAAGKRGTPKDSVAAVSSAYAAFERHVERFAGDRTSFDSMVSSASGTDTAAQADLASRRMIFEGQRHLWGVELSCRVQTVFLHSAASGQPELFDYASLRTSIGLTRLRADAPVRVDAGMLRPPEGGVDTYERDTFDHNAARTYGAPIIPGFSSSPVPQFKSVRTEDGRSKTELVGDAVGRPGTVDLTFGMVSRNAPLSARRDGRMGFAVHTHFAYPTRKMISNVFVHRAAFGDIDTDAAIFGHVTDLAGLPSEKTHTRMACHERIEHRGTTPVAMRLAEFPNFPDLVRMAMDRQNWRLEDFEMYRFSIEYPVLDTGLILEFMVRG